MMDQVFFLTKNYPVQCKKFNALLEHVRVGCTTSDDAEKMMKLHHVFYKVDKEFKEKIENHKKNNVAYLQQCWYEEEKYE